MLDPEFLRLARDLVAADSVTDRGNLPAVDVLEPLCRRAELSVRRLVESDRDVNLLAGPGGGQGAKGDPLLLVTHLDTVDPGPRDRWRTDPFQLTLEGNRAIGLGVADVKLDALCKLWAVHRLRNVPLRRPFYFLGTWGEESGLRGARAFMEAPPFRPWAALCGEPSELTLCHAHKGYAVVRVRVHCLRPTTYAASPAVLVAWEGKAAHSSTPALGINAIDRALDALAVPGVPYAMAINGGQSANAIPARCEAVVYMRPGCGPSLWKTEDRPLPPQDSWANVTTLLPIVIGIREAWRARVASLQPLTDVRFDPPAAVANVTRIRTEHDAVEMTLDARLLPEHDAEAFVAAFREEVGRLSTDETEITTEADRCASGMSLPADHAYVKACGEALFSLGLSGTPRAKPTSTEAGVFVRAGVPALVFGPSPSTGNAHTANEYALLDQVERAIDAYEALLLHLCR
jgi:acetylornithine deacetylase/succinyl-diaminopimelate desuccinylase-like protein